MQNEEGNEQLLWTEAVVSLSSSFSSSFFFCVRVLLFVLEKLFILQLPKATSVITEWLKKASINEDAFKQWVCPFA